MNIDLSNISLITDDSRQVVKNSIFVAIKGLTVDGGKFIPDAVAKGASVVVGEDEPSKEILGKIKFIKVDNARLALGELLSDWYKNPSDKLTVIGVTGTDGKTTTANLIHHVFESSGTKAGVISTINAKVSGEEIDTGFHVTNPGPVLLQKLLAKMVQNKCKYAVLEVTSHGIDQERIAGVHFDLSVLTNITHEHLDYHKTFENYRLIKARFMAGAKSAILNADDKSFGFIRKYLPKNRKVVTYSLKNIKNLKMDSRGMKFILQENSKEYEIRTSLLGIYNISNILAAIAVARYYELPMVKIITAIASFQTPEGRMQVVKNHRGIRIIIDFAHTPAALENILTTLKIFVPKVSKLIAIFGSAGERDKTKRPLMGRVASKLADFSIITAEDPRTEDVGRICSEIAAGFSNKNRYQIIPDRKEAIDTAINKIAKKDDIVVICGKGHEKSMCFGTTEVSWSDLKTIQEILSRPLLT